MEAEEDLVVEAEGDLVEAEEETEVEGGGLEEVEVVVEGSDPLVVKGGSAGVVVVVALRGVVEGEEDSEEA